MPGKDSDRARPRCGLTSLLTQPHKVSAPGDEHGETQESCESYGCACAFQHILGSEMALIGHSPPLSAFDTLYTKERTDIPTRHVHYKIYTEIRNSTREI